MNSTRRIHWGSLLIGILFILASLISFRDPVGNLQNLVLVFAVFAIVKGFYELFLRNSLCYLTGLHANLLVAIGIVDVIIGIFFLVNIHIGLVALPFVFAIWFLLDSLVGLCTVRMAKLVSDGYYGFQLIINVLGIIIGVVLLFNPVLVIFTVSFLVGIYFMLFGITNFIEAFAR